jgi:hypothetical protein
MTKKTFRTTIVRDGPMCFIPIPFDPRPVFGKVRVPVKVTLNGHTYPSTIASMGNGPCLPLRRSNREAAGLEGTETLSVTLTLDAAKREIRPPADFTRALKTKAGAWERFRKLSYSHQREHVEAIEDAKKPETRARRIALAVHDIGSRKDPLNREWHARHPMPTRPTREQRVAWHLAHQKQCGCRPIPKGLTK